MMASHNVFRAALVVCALTFALSAAAVSPEVVRAVADRPLVVTLVDGSQLDIEVVELGEERFIVIDGEGNVAELGYSEVTALRVRSSTTEVPLTPAETTPPVSSARAEQPDEAYLSAESQVPEEQAAQEEAGAGEAESFAGLYARFGLNSGYGRLRRVNWQDDVESVIRSQALNLGFNAAVGIRFASLFSFHLTLGVQRFFRVSERSGRIFDSDADSYFRPVDYRIRLVTIAPGVTFHFGGFLVSFSTGFAGTKVWGGQLSDGTSEWGFGGDFLVGYAVPISASARVGVGFSLNWVRIPEDEFGSRSTAATMGPQLFLTY